MAKFLFSYRAPKDYTMGQQETMSAWAAWFTGIGASLNEIGAPVSESAALGDPGDGTGLAGYSIVTADDLEAALALAQGCPVLPDGGGVEVGLLIEIPAGSGSPA
jgi:hypothetical protein